MQYQSERNIRHFKPHVDLMNETVTCEYVERPFTTEAERAAMIAEIANDLDGVREYLHEWFGSRVADSDGELPSSLDETMTALASINHVLDSFGNTRRRNSKKAKLLTAYKASRHAEAHTHRERVAIAKNHTLSAIEELEKADAYDARVTGVRIALEGIEDALSDVLKDNEPRSTEKNALRWRVDATDERGEHVTTGIFTSKNDAEEYAHWLQSADLRATVKETA